MYGGFPCQRVDGGALWRDGCAGSLFRGVCELVRAPAGSAIVHTAQLFGRCRFAYELQNTAPTARDADAGDSKKSQ